MLVSNPWHYLQEGDSALHFSSARGDVEVAKALLEHGAQVNLLNEVSSLHTYQNYAYFYPMYVEIFDTYIPCL